MNLKEALEKINEGENPSMVFNSFAISQKLMVSFSYTEVMINEDDNLMFECKAQLKKNISFGLGQNKKEAKRNACLEMLKKLKNE